MRAAEKGRQRVESSGELLQRLPLPLARSRRAPLQRREPGGLRARVVSAASGERPDAAEADGST